MRVFGFYQQYSDADGFYSCEECGAAPRQPCDKDCPIRMHDPVAGSCYDGLCPCHGEIESHESGYLDHAIWLEGLAERAEKRAARCREKLAGEPS